jgi:uncharacterized protein
MLSETSTPNDFRRALVLSAAGVFVSPAHSVSTWTPPVWAGPVLDLQQSRLIRAWIIRLVSAQIRYGPTPRWFHRDCAGLIRFAVAESFREHDLAWRRSNGLVDLPMPPEIALDSVSKNQLRHRWRLSDGSHSAYASAIDIVQGNCSFQSKQWQNALPADLLFFDHGDEQHLMVWMGQHVAYHTGSSTPQDNGLRAVTISALMQWRDTRWQPHKDNPNFAGIYRLAFLAR